MVYYGNILSCVEDGKMAKKKISLIIYGLSIIDGENKRRDLNALIDNKSMIDCIEEYIRNNMLSYSNDETKDTLFQFERVETEIIKNGEGQKEYQIIYGRVKTGEYGIESELVNVRTGEITKRSIEQADMMPFGFCIAVPAGQISNAVIILQTMGVYGMKLSLQRHLQKCLTDICTDFHLSMRAIAPKEYVDRYFNSGILKKIKMIRYEIPEEESNRIGINYGVKQTKEERIIHKPLGFLERKKKEMQEWFSGQRSYTDIIEMEGFEYDDLKLEFSLGDTDKTFNLRDMNNLIVNEDITKKVNQDGGHPIYESLKPVMQDTAKEYLKGMGLLV